MSNGDEGSLLRRLFPRARPELLDAVARVSYDVLTRYEINTPRRRAHFWGQVSAETGGLQRLEENLNYTSAERLRAIFPSRFATAEAATPYVRQPEKLANLVYAGRLGNGDTASGDGWRYRGRGFLQLTGRANYKAFGDRTGMPVEREPELAADPVQGLTLAAAYWKARGINEAADSDDVRAVTRLINPALAGLEERRTATEQAKSQLGA